MRRTNEFLGLRRRRQTRRRCFTWINRLVVCHWSGRNIYCSLPKPTRKSFSNYADSIKSSKFDSIFDSIPVDLSRSESIKWHIKFVFVNWKYLTKPFDLENLLLLINANRALFAIFWVNWFCQECSLKNGL